MGQSLADLSLRELKRILRDTEKRFPETKSVEMIREVLERKRRALRWRRGGDNG